MNIEIYNKIYKLLLSIGFSLIAYSMYQIDSLKLKQLDYIINSNNRYSNFNSLLEDYSNWYLKILLLGIIFLFIGIVLWLPHINSETLLDKKFKNCQSCGKNFSGNRYYGTNIDKTINFFYCYECYNDGNFSNPDLKYEDLLTEENKKKYRETKLKMSFAKYIKSLKRWNDNEYN